MVMHAVRDTVLSLGQFPERTRAGPHLCQPDQEIPVSAELFRDDDHGYAAWLAGNARGYVLNIQRSMNSSDARVHEAVCRTITGHAAARQDMDRPLRQGMLPFARRVGRLGSVTRPFTCHPVPHLQPLS
jgi:hypothetical protein